MNKKWSVKKIFLQNQMFNLMYFIFFRRLLLLLFLEKKKSQMVFDSFEKNNKKKRWLLWILIWFGCLLAHTRTYTRNHILVWISQWNLGWLSFIVCTLFFSALDFRRCNLDRHNDNSALAAVCHAWLWLFDYIRLCGVWRRRRPRPRRVRIHK